MSSARSESSRSARTSSCRRRSSSNCTFVRGPRFSGVRSRTAPIVPRSAARSPGSSRSQRIATRMAAVVRALPLRPVSFSSRTRVEDGVHARAATQIRAGVLAEHRAPEPSRPGQEPVHGNTDGAPVGVKLASEFVEASAGFGVEVERSLHPCDAGRLRRRAGPGPVLRPHGRGRPQVAGRPTAPAPRNGAARCRRPTPRAIASSSARTGGGWDPPPVPGPFPLPGGPRSLRQCRTGGACTDCAPDLELRRHGLTYAN
ncbi:hypothetical protein M2275_008170 [Rhodococcus opacus]|nr:hypothetical protein [Rhodococcus opacus]